MSVQQKNNETIPLLEREEIDHSRYAILIVILNVGLNFALYGFQNVMSTYIKCYLDMPGSAGALTNTFTALAYVVALASGIVADSAWGLYKTIMVATVLFFFANVALLVGNLVFLFTSNDIVQYVCSFTGVALFVLGSGGTKACTSAFLGDQFGPSEAQQAKRSRFYSWYYLSIQFGSIGVSVAAPIILAQQPWGAWGLFAILGGVFFIVVPIYLTGAKKFNRRPPQGSVYSTLFKIVACALRNRSRRQSGDHWLDPAKAEYDDALVEDVKALARVALLFTPLPAFWAIFFQMYSVWVAQSSAMNLRIGGSHPSSSSSLLMSAPLLVFEAVGPALTVTTECLSQGSNTTAGGSGGWVVPPALTITLNPIFDVIMIPLFASALYPALSRCVKVTPLRKMSAGLIFTALALIVAGLVEVAMIKKAPELLSIFWIIPQYFLVSVAEILLSVTVYELAYTEAPSSMKGLVTGLMFLTVAAGNAILAGLQLIPANRAILNFSYAGAIAVIFVIFVVLAVKYQYRVQPGEDVIEEINE